ncbi:MAG: hypothetical protein CME61_00390 [Halobacteriovoraceae bacterium]|nr:hypothetical protein [Halobacteriovoraceae bacterium]|tara:strand:+ start:441 stop:821 length:381 start_codon:yes stop_codon:yes gene_type:complete
MSKSNDFLQQIINGELQLVITASEAVVFNADKEQLYIGLDWVGSRPNKFKLEDGFCLAPEHRQRLGLGDNVEEDTAFFDMIIQIVNGDIRTKVTPAMDKRRYSIDNPWIYDWHDFVEKRRKKLYKL